MNSKMCRLPRCATLRSVCRYCRRRRCWKRPRIDYAKRNCFDRLEFLLPTFSPVVGPRCSRRRGEKNRTACDSENLPDGIRRQGAVACASAEDVARAKEANAAATGAETQICRGRGRTPPLQRRGRQRLSSSDLSPLRGNSASSPSADEPARLLSTSSSKTIIAAESCGYRLRLRRISTPRSSARPSKPPAASSKTAIRRRARDRIFRTRRQAAR